ncbi:MAG: hypothetical protein ACXVHB_33265 [Solirubrobacteraceae bacterium]
MSDIPYPYPDHMLDRDETLFGITDMLGRRVEASLWVSSGTGALGVQVNHIIGRLSSSTGRYFGDDGALYYFIDCGPEAEDLRLELPADAVRDGAQMFRPEMPGLALRVHLTDDGTALHLYERGEDE